MKLKNSVLLVVIAVVATGAVLGASAFTTFSADRDANIDVVSDNSGILALDAGASSFVSLQNGQLAIDVTQGGANGVNVDSTLNIGDNANPSSEYAFTVTNNDNSAHDLSFEYTGVSADSDGDANVQYAVYDSTGTQVGTFSENSAMSITGAASGETYYVVLTVDTVGASTADDLSGTVTLTAE